MARKSILEDLRWAWLMFRVRRYRADLGFRRRMIFDDALRPPIDTSVIAYPDAVYHIKYGDYARAVAQSWMLRPRKPDLKVVRP